MIFILSGSLSKTRRELVLDGNTDFFYNNKTIKRAEINKHISNIFSTSSYGLWKKYCPLQTYICF